MEVYSHDTSSLDGDNKRRDWRYIPAHQLLPKMLKVDPCQSFSKYISQFIYCINLKDIDSTFNNFLTKPYGLSSIIIASKCELWVQGLFQDQSSIIVLMNRDINCCLSYGKFYWFSKIFSHIYHGKKFSVILI